MHLTDAQPPLSVAQLKEELDEQLTPCDAALMKAYFMHYDCENLVALMENPEAEIDPHGNFELEDYQQMMVTVLEEEKKDKRFPIFMQNFVKNYATNKTQQGWFAKDAMMAAYYEWASQSKDGMMADWYVLNTNILNILTALIARRQGWDLASYVQGHNEVVDLILENPNAHDFTLGLEYEFVKDLMACADTEDPVEKERKIDALRWNWLEKSTFFDTFGIDAVFSYVVRTEMLERWAKLDVEQGKERFTEIIENLRGEARVPSEFILKKIK